MAVAAGKVTGGQRAARCVELGIEGLALGEDLGDVGVAKRTASVSTKRQT